MIILAAGRGWRRSLVAACLLGIGLTASAGGFVGFAQQPVGGDTPAAERRASIEPMLVVHRYADAEAAARQWLAEVERGGRADSVDAAYALDLIVQAVSRTSAVAKPESIELGKRCVDLKRRRFGEAHLEYAESLGYFARLLLEAGKRGDGASALEDALAIQERTVERADRRQRLLYARNLLETAALYRNQPEAGPGLERAIRIAEADADIESLAWGLRLQALRREDRSERRQLIDRAASLYEQLGGADFERAVCLVDGAQTSWNMGDATGAMARFQNAEAALDRARDGISGRTPTDQRWYAALWTSIGVEYDDIADSDLKSARFDAALSLAERALAILSRESANPRDRLAGPLMAVARAAAGAGRPDRAFEAALQSEQASRANLRDRASMDPCPCNFGGLDVALSLLADGRVDGRSALEPAWDSVVRSRGLAIELSTERYRLARDSTDPEAKRLADAAQAARELLDNMVIGTPALSEDDPAYLAAHSRQGHAEGALAQRLLEQGSSAAGDAVALVHVGAALPSTTALVAYRMYRHITWQADQSPGISSADAYLAFVLQAGSAPKVVKLGPAADIHRLIGAMADTFDEQMALATGPSRRLEQAYRAAAGELRRKIWDPIVPLVGQSTRVLIVPDSAISLVNFDALPIGDARYLAESGPVLHYLSVERDVVLTALSVSAEGMLAIGAPAFSGGQNTRARPAPTPTSASATAPSARFRGRTLGCGSFDQLQFSDLPGSQSELAEVSSAWDRGTQSPVTLLTGAAATERAFKAAAPGKRVLHVSSHGFFLNGPCQSDRKPVLPAADRIGSLTWTDEGIMGKHPLLLSGLALVGSDRRTTLAAGGDDGVLTADEIAVMDLKGVEWAVLSACETGVGKVRAGEGVIGLRRAFQIAGVHTVITSLWQIEDQGARDWMRRLYQHRFGEHLDTAGAVRAATLGELRARRAAGAGTHPIYWAGFVALGDWR